MRCFSMYFSLSQVFRWLNKQKKTFIIQWNICCLLWSCRIYLTVMIRFITRIYVLEISWMYFTDASDDWSALPSPFLLSMSIVNINFQDYRKFLFSLCSVSCNKYTPKQLPNIQQTLQLYYSKWVLYHYLSQEYHPYIFKSYLFYKLKQIFTGCTLSVIDY